MHLTQPPLSRQVMLLEQEVGASLLDRKGVTSMAVYAVRDPGEGPNLAQAIMACFGELGGVELDLPPRPAAPRAAEFGGGQRS